MLDQEAEAGRFWVQGQPGLQSEFQDSQGYTEKPCLKKTKQNKQTNKQTNNALSGQAQFYKYSCIHFVCLI